MQIKFTFVDRKVQDGRAHYFCDDEGGCLQWQEANSAVLSLQMIHNLPSKQKTSIHAIQSSEL